MKMLKIVLFVMACLGFVMAGELKYDGLFGQWTNEVKPADGFYLCGAEMRFEDNKVGVNDDTATNGFRFKFCQYDNWNNQKLS